MFTVEQRDALRDHLLRLAEEDEHVVAGAAVGSLAVDGGDRFSDLDLTFGIADHVSVADVLDDWTRTLVDELDAVHLADLQRGPTTFQQRPWLDSRLPTLARSNLGRSGQPSPRPFLHSSARAPRRVYRTRIPSRSASLNFADEPLR